MGVVFLDTDLSRWFEDELSSGEEIWWPGAQESE